MVVQSGPRSRRDATPKGVKAYKFCFGEKRPMLELCFSCVALAVSYQPLHIEEDIEGGPFIMQSRRRREAQNTIHRLAICVALLSTTVTGALTDFLGQRFVGGMSLLSQLVGVTLLNMTDEEAAWNMGALFAGLGSTGLLNATIPLVEKFSSLRVMALSCLFGAWKFATAVPHAFQYLRDYYKIGEQQLLLVYLVTIGILFILALFILPGPIPRDGKAGKGFASVLHDDNAFAVLCFQFLSFVRSLVFVQTPERFEVVGEMDACSPLIFLSRLTDCLSGIPATLWALIVDHSLQNGLAISLWATNTCAAMMWALRFVNSFVAKALSMLFWMYQETFIIMSLHTYLAVTRQFHYICTLGSLSFWISSVRMLVDMRRWTALEADLPWIGAVMLTLSIALYLPPSYLYTRTSKSENRERLKKL
eukprot:GHVN01065978.1.p1 GENE.GHVN01065978.1~~GHVN01065978.1.p1  ORF type:complete len:420 (-),score=24.31 GHVN01065978.1:172-1431(-)